MSESPRKFREFRVTLAGVAEVGFTMIEHQVANDAEEAIRLVKEKASTRPLDLLDPKITSTSAPRLQQFEIESAVLL